MSTRELMLRAAHTRTGERIGRALGILAAAALVAKGLS